MSGIKSFDIAEFYNMEEEGTLEEAGFFYAWGCPDGDEGEHGLVNLIAERLAPLGITIELASDDDFGAIRLLKDGKVINS